MKQNSLHFEAISRFGFQCWKDPDYDLVWVYDRYTGRFLGLYDWKIDIKVLVKELVRQQWMASNRDLVL